MDCNIWIFKLQPLQDLGFRFPCINNCFVFIFKHRFRVPGRDDKGIVIRHEDLVFTWDGCREV